MLHKSKVSSQDCQWLARGPSLQIERPTYSISIGSRTYLSGLQKATKRLTGDDVISEQDSANKGLERVSPPTADACGRLPIINTSRRGRTQTGRTIDIPLNEISPLVSLGPC